MRKIEIIMVVMIMRISEHWFMNSLKKQKEKSMYRKGTEA